MKRLRFGKLEIDKKLGPGPLLAHYILSRNGEWLKFVIEEGEAIEIIQHYQDAFELDKPKLSEWPCKWLNKPPYAVCCHPECKPVITR